ncbi:MAG: condensation domain-containing protein, partial [Acidobacteria bacterium]|nr:condensation domain-containing protein [Acidobacteriota bacterium]
MLDKLGRLWLYGVNIDWPVFHSDYPDHKRCRVPLPGYPFERQRYWQIIDDLKGGNYLFQRAINAANEPGNGESGFTQTTETQLREYKTARYERPQLSTRYTPPQNDIEQVMVKIWQHIFGIEEIGIIDDFFELGGDSLKAINVLSMLHKETSRQVPLEYFFDHPTIAQVATYDGDKETVFVAIQTLEKKEYYCLSSAQKRMYFFQQVDPGSVAYNNFLANTIEGDIDTEKLSTLFKKLIHRHESLRTSFIEINGEVVQRVHEQVEFEIAVMGVISEDGQARTFIRPFDLSRAPLLRVGLIDRILIVDMHHIISDGSSLAILIEEFMGLCRDEELPFLPLQYKDYAGWQNREMAGGALASQRDYWLDEFTGDIPVLDLPYDYIRPEVRTFAGKVLNFEINSEQTRALDRLASGQGVTLYMVLLAITNIFLARLSGQETVVVGTPTAGRTHADLARIIGMFVNTLALKHDVKGEKNTKEFLNEIKEKTLRAFANQEYQYEELVEHLQIDRSSGRNPLFDTLFALQNVEIRGLTIPDPTIKNMGLNVQPFPFEMGTVKFDLSIECFEFGDKLSFNMEYGTELFKEETAARFAAYFKKIISAVVEKPHEKIAAIEIISEQEKEQLLFQFNETSAAYPQDKTIPQLFADQAAQTPDYIALHGCMIGWMHGCMIAWMDGEVGANRHPRTNTDNNN